MYPCSFSLGCGGSEGEHLGAITAGKVIEVVGTTFGEEAWEDIFRLVKKVRNERYLF